VKVGWEFTTWSGKSQPCAIPSCTRVVNAGHVRVDYPNPSKGDAVVCVVCWGMIMAGLDPDPKANVPAWEEENREKRLTQVTEDADGQDATS
jgi:hypothetical protein